MEGFIQGNEIISRKVLLEEELGCLQDLRQHFWRRNQSKEGYFELNDFFEQFGAVQKLSGDVRSQARDKNVKLLVEKFGKFRSFKNSKRIVNKENIDKTKFVKEKRMQVVSTSFYNPKVKKTELEKALKIQHELQDITKTQNHLRNRELQTEEAQQYLQDSDFLKEYLQLTVVEVLKEGLKNLQLKEPEDFVDFLADYLFENSDISIENNEKVLELIKKVKLNK
jgi:hypothetical protein